MIQYLGSRERVLIQITAPNGRQYRYWPPVDKEFRPFPFSEGNGSYTIDIFEGAGNSYVPVDKLELSVSMSNNLAPFLTPSYFVDFTARCKIITDGAQISAGSKNDIEKVSAIYNWFVENVKYDDVKAKNVQSGYVPNLARLMRDKDGICFDYAAGMTAMLRSQGVATRMEFGNITFGGQTIYHAWISIYTAETGWVNGWIQFRGNRWVLMEPTWAAVNGDSNKGFRDFVTAGTNHVTHFIY